MRTESFLSSVQHANVQDSNPGFNNTGSNQIGCSDGTKLLMAAIQTAALAKEC